MKAGIHPQYHQVQATCVCGNVISTGSTQSTIKMDICSACHPFFTGTQKIIDTEGRVEKFKKRYAQSQQAAPAGKKAKKQEKAREESAVALSEVASAVAVTEEAAPEAVAPEATAAEEQA